MQQLSHVFAAPLASFRGAPGRRGAQFGNRWCEESNLTVQSQLLHYAKTTNILFTGNSLIHSYQQSFTTKDRDNDRWPGNCAQYRYGAFWYKDCSTANLNGKYLRNGIINRTGVIWEGWKNNYYSMKKVEMKIKPN